MLRLSISDFRKDAAEALNRVAYQGERVLLHRRDKDVAVVVSLEDAELLRAMEDKADLRAARKAKREAAREGTVSLAAVKKRLGID
jgi:prevent-host-death family protein